MTIWDRFPQPRSGWFQTGFSCPANAAPCPHAGCVCLWGKVICCNSCPNFKTPTNGPFFEPGEGQEAKQWDLVCPGVSMLGTGGLDTGAKLHRAVRVQYTPLCSWLSLSALLGHWSPFLSVYLKHNLLALVVPPLLKSSLLPCAAALMGTMAGEPARVALQRCWGKTANKPANINCYCPFRRRIQLLEDCLERKLMHLSASVLWHALEFRWVPLFFLMFSLPNFELFSPLQKSPRRRKPHLSP